MANREAAIINFAEKNFLAYYRSLKLGSSGNPIGK
jgi:hypothetical protein